MKKIIAIFLIFLIASGGFFLAFVKSARALTSVDADYLVTYDTTPLLTGSIDEAGSSVTVTIDGQNYAATVDDTSWTLQVDSALETGIYDLALSATKGVTTVNNTVVDGLVIDTDFPFNIYVDVSLLEDLLALTFNTGQTFSLNGITLTIPDNTTITRTDGGGYNLSQMIGDSLENSNESIAQQIEFGIPGVDLTFSNPITLEVEVGSSYDGQRLNIFTKSGDDDEWESMGTSCVVSGGICAFQISHASYFAMSPNDSLIDEEPDVDKIKAKKYFSPLSGKWKVELIIRGDEYNKDTEVTLGNRDAYEVKYKNKHKLVARFSLDKLLRSGQNGFIVRVINGEQEEKFDKKLKISELTEDYQKL